MASKKSKVLQSKRRLIVVVAATFALVLANLATVVHIWPLTHMPYRTSAELADFKDWNWGLASKIQSHFGSVTLTNIGSLETNGIYIPAELAAANNLVVSNQSGPMTLKPSQIGALRTWPNANQTVSKTRCLGRELTYCPVIIFSSDEINPKPSNFVAIVLKDTEFGLVEEKLLNQLIESSKR